MDNPISLDLHKFPEQSRLIADMLLGYADMESFILDLVGQALGGNANDAAPVLYRLRGAEDRLNIADALLKPFMAKIGIPGPYGQWLGAIRRCKAIRNQYAHCIWGPDGNNLAFADLQQAAETGIIDFKRVELSLLQEQHRYFQFVMGMMFYLMAEARYRRDRRRRHKRKMPKSLPSPSLHSLPH
jgi:hypothetical protein